MKKASIGFSQKNVRLQGYLIMISQYLKCSYVEGGGIYFTRIHITVQKVSGTYCFKGNSQRQ